jgi:hypothetical protein
MKATPILIPFLFSIASLAFAQDVTGDWHGTLSVNGAELRLVLHISKNSGGGLKATLDSIDQNANGIPVSSAALRGSALSLRVDAIQGSYEGQVNAAGSEISGTWTQGAPLELTFHRGAEFLPRLQQNRPSLPILMETGWERSTPGWESCDWCCTSATPIKAWPPRWTVPTRTQKGCRLQASHGAEWH